MIPDRTNIAGEWLVRAPGERQRNQGAPQLLISLAGETWDEIKEAWADMLSKHGQE